MCKIFKHFLSKLVINVFLLWDEQLKCYPSVFCFNSVEMKIAWCHCQTYSGRFDEQAHRKNCLSSGMLWWLARFMCRCFPLIYNSDREELTFFRWCTHNVTIQNSKRDSSLKSYGICESLEVPVWDQTEPWNIFVSLLAHRFTDSLISYCHTVEHIRF